MDVAEAPELALSSGQRRGHSSDATPSTPTTDAPRRVCRKYDLIGGSVCGMAQSLFPRSPTRLIRERAEVESYIRSEIGFEPTVIEQSIRAGASDAAMVTHHNAASAYGYRFWDGLVTSLRDQLVPRGWTCERPGQLEVVRRSDNRLQITGSLGDEAVGVQSARVAVMTRASRQMPPSDTTS